MRWLCASQTGSEPPPALTSILTLVLATRNKGKVREFQRLFAELLPGKPLEVTIGSDIGLGDVDETGPTFLENARIKATAAAAECGRVCLGEDSGLEVDFLGGAPGVKSHRYSESGLDQDNNLLLLENLKGVPPPARGARYRCAICIAASDEIIAEGEGVVEGRIGEEFLGENGFGYDPLFYSTELGKTLGEASAVEKDSVSHRRRAMEKVAQRLRESACVTEEGFP